MALYSIAFHMDALRHECDTVSVYVHSQVYMALMVTFLLLSKTVFILYNLTQLAVLQQPRQHHNSQLVNLSSHQVM